jgi:hypothetical protein
MMPSSKPTDNGVGKPYWAGAVGSVSYRVFVLQAWLPLASGLFNNNPLFHQTLNCLNALYRF